MTGSRRIRPALPDASHWPSLGELILAEIRALRQGTRAKDMSRAEVYRRFKEHRIHASLRDGRRS